MTHESIPRCIRRHARAAVAMVGLLAAVGSASAQTASDMPASSPMSPSTVSGKNAGSASKALHRSMVSGMEKMKDMKLSGQTDRDFATLMKMHHQQALEMAKLEIDHGSSAELKAMARKIISGQTKEIAQFDAWAAKHP